MGFPPHSKVKSPTNLPDGSGTLGSSHPVASYFADFGPFPAARYSGSNITSQLSLAFVTHYKQIRQWKAKCISLVVRLPVWVWRMDRGRTTVGSNFRKHDHEARLRSRFAIRKRALRQGLFIVIALVSLASTPSQEPKPEFMPLESAKPVLQKMGSSDGSHPSPNVGSQDWIAWLQKSDAQVRQRLDTGEEDSLTNLLRFGVTYTKEYRIDDEYLVRYGQSSLVNAFAENRANDLIKALAAPNGNQGFVEMRAFVEKKGFSP